LGGKRAATNLSGLVTNRPVDELVRLGTLVGHQPFRDEGSRFAFCDSRRRINDRVHAFAEIVVWQADDGY
jgi:hypothetical protein